MFELKFSLYHFSSKLLFPFFAILSEMFESRNLRSTVTVEMNYNNKGKIGKKKYSLLPSEHYNIVKMLNLPEKAT